MLHADQKSVDQAVMAALGSGRIDDLLDIGTGAGHMLLLLGDRTERGVGVDRSAEMLAVARHKLFQAALRHCEVRQADMTALPFETGSFTAATLSMVLHFAEEPAAVIAEAARVLRPGGKAVLVDFAEHEMTSLREDQAHRWLGFDDRNVQKWARDAGLDMTAKRLKGRRIDRGLDAYPSRGTPRRGAATLSRPCAAQHLAVEADERPPTARPNWLPRSKFRDSENSLPMER